MRRELANVVTYSSGMTAVAGRTMLVVGMGGIGREIAREFAELTDAVGADSPVLDRIIKSETIRVGMSGNQPPFNAKGRDGSLIGLEVDLARALAGALGVKIDCTPEIAAKCLAENGITFFFAPAYHGAMKHAGPVRREIGVRSVFNLLGPLVVNSRTRQGCQLVLDDSEYSTRTQMAA